MSTKIEWTDETWNPVTGCTKVSAGCKHCYAKRLWGRLSAPGMPYEGRDFEDVQTHADRLDVPLHWRKPRMVFVNSMSDLFHEDVPFEFIDYVFAVMALSPQHTFQILTKRPERMREYLTAARATPVGMTALGICADHLASNPRSKVGQGVMLTGDIGHLKTWPLPNVWLGVSVEDQATADERIPILLGTPAAVRWVSAEPLLGPVDFSPWLRRGDDDLRDLDPLAYGLLQMGVESGNAWVRPALDWIVAGGESGPGARPMHPDWPRAIRDQCAAAGVPFFFKQFGEWGWLSQIGDQGPKVRQAGDHAGADVRFKVGKARAGHLLDGRDHREFPAPRTAP